MLLHLGFAGYRAVALQDLRNARTLSRALENCGYYEVLSDIHRPVSSSLVGDIKSKMNQVDVEVCALNSEVLHDADHPQNYMPGLPVVAFRFSETYRTKHPDVQQKWIQTLLRSKGWIVPNYELAPNLSEIEILRVVVRETVSEVLIERLIADIVSLPPVTAPIPLTARLVDRHYRVPCQGRHPRPRSQRSYPRSRQAPRAPSRIT